MTITFTDTEKKHVGVKGKAFHDSCLIYFADKRE